MICFKIESWKILHGLLQLMSVMTRDNRFEDVYSPDMERRPTNMCEVLDRVENRGIQKGKGGREYAGAECLRNQQ